MTREDVDLTALGIDPATVTGEDLEAAAERAYTELVERDVDLRGVASGAAQLDALEAEEGSP